MNLEEARSLPELAGLDDEQIVDALHQAYYPDLPRDQVAASLGVTPKPPPAPQATWGDRAKDTGISLLKGAIGVPEAAVGLADLATGGKAGQLAEEAGFRPKEAKEALSEHYSPAQKAAFEQVQRAEGLWDTFKAAVSNPSTVIQSTVESLPAMGAGGVVARGGMAMLPKMGPVMAGAAGEGITQAGSAAEQTRQEAGTLDAKGAGAAIASGAIDTAIARFSGGLAKKLGIADVDTMLAGAAVNPKAAKGVVRAALQGMVTEGLLEELPQSVQEQVWANYAAGKPLDEGVNQAAVLGTLSGGLMGGGANVLNSMRTPAKPTVEDILAAPDVDTAIKTAQAAVAPPVAPEVVAPPVDSSVGKSLTGTDPATLLQRPDSFMDAVREPRSATGTAAGDLLASQPQDPLLGPAREDATAREDQRQDLLATRAEQRMRREVDSEAQNLREWPPTSKREPAQPELDEAIQPGDLLDKAGAPFKELAAKLKAKNIGGEVIAVKGGFIVRPKKKEQPDASNQPANAATPVADSARGAPAIPAEPAVPASRPDDQPGGIPATDTGIAGSRAAPVGEQRPADGQVVGDQGDVPAPAANVAEAAGGDARVGGRTAAAGPVVGAPGPSGVPAPENEPERRPGLPGLEADQPAGGQAPAAVASDPAARWAAMPPAEREALLSKTAAKGKSRQRVAGQAWDDLAPGWKRAIERVMGPENVSRVPAASDKNAPKSLSQNEKTSDASQEKENVSRSSVDESAARAELDAAKADPEGRELSPEAQALNDREGAERFQRDHQRPAPAGLRPSPAAENWGDQPRDPESGQFVEAEVQAVLESRRKNNASGQGGEDVDKIRAAVTARQAATTNTVFTDDMAEKAREVLKRKLKDKLPGYSPGGKQAGSAPMLDPEVMLAGITLAGYHIERGARTFAAYARTMLADLGDEVRPSLKSWYMAVKYDPRAAAFSGEMSSAAFVEEFDLSHLAAPSDTPALESQPPKADTGEANGTSAATRDLDSAGPGPLEGAPAGDVRAPAGERPAGGSAAGRGNVDQQRDAEPDASRRDLGPGVGADAGAVPVSAAGGRGRREGAGNARLPRAPRPDAGAGLFDDAGREDPGLSAPNAPPIAAPQFKPEDVADFTIEDDFALGEGGQKTKFRNNLAAIKLAKELLEAENSPGGARTATADEQQVLAKYVGWGGLPQAFDPNNAEWSKEHAELKAVLTDEEFAAARQSTRYAHYTSREIIQDGIYAALRRFGFTGGRVLEGGAGVGNFIGLMPQDMRSAGRVTAVEREPIAATIARALYPLQNVQRADFTEFKGNDGYFDAAVGNPPFASDPQTDRSGRKHLSGLSLHNYFFAKEVDMLREGGVLAQVVTNSFLDSAGDRARKYISDRTKFLGAIRLPNNAFSKNAGTEVTTDLIFLQKRPEAEWGSKAARAEAKAWLDVAKQYDPRKGASYNLNQYFVDHPEMMLGDFGAHGTMYGPNQPALIARPGQDTAALLREAVQRLPADIYVDRAVLGTDTAIENATRALSNPPVQEGGFYIEDGKLIQRVPDVAGEARGREITASTQWTAKTALGDSGFDKIVRLSSMRETLRDLLAAELSGNPMMDSLRLQLNEKYDQYVKEHGLLGDPGTARVFDDDPDFPLLLSLEHNYTPGIGIAAAKRQGLKATKSTAKKAPIFKQRVVDARKTVQKVETPADALAVSMAERGKLDTAYIGKLLDKDPDQVLKELSTGDKPMLFLDPATDEYVLRDAYLSGNVRAKLEQANRAGLSLNARELERVIPDDVGAHEIVAKIGSPWVPTSVYADFASDLFGEGTKARVQYIKANSSYAVSVQAGNQLNATSKWGIEAYTGPELLAALLNNRAIKVTYRDGEGKTHTDIEKTDLANTKAQEIRDRFQDWLFADAERSELLVRTYNDTNNNYVTREYDGAWMTFPGKVPDSVIKFRRHQRNAIARIVQDRTALLDHVVGAGKTFTIVAGAMDLRRTGLARKSMVAVPNHLVKQWAADFYRLYPGANILTATKKDFEKVNRRRFLAKIATGDWDAVVIAHSSFGFIKPGAEFEAEFNKRQVKMIMDTIREVKDGDGDGPAKKRTVKQLEGMKERLENRVKSLRDKAMDDLLDFEQLGIDQLFIDEAHSFKNLMFTTKMQGVQGLGDAKGSQRAYDMYVKSQEVLEKNGRGQGLVFATGTPVSNSLAEKYHMMRYLMPKQMEDLGFQSFDAWANTFASVEQVWMQKPSGDGYKASNRMSNFVNVHELLKMFDQVADTVTMDDIKKAYKEENDGKEFPIPPLKTGRRQPVSLEKSPAQIAYMEKIAQRAKALEMRKGPPRKGEDNVLVIMGDARKAAMDIRLVDPTINEREPGGRIDAAASRILDRYQQWNHVKGTQLVFSDLGTPKKHAQAELKEFNALMERVNAADEDVRSRAVFGAEDAQAIVDDAEDAQAAIDANGPDWMTAVQAALRGFSVYDDLKDALVERGIPENEIAFIHDYNTDERKASLFRKVNAGDIRVLIGSTAKMGAGTNVQERLVAEHHLDVPWRPSDVEQREGRIERQGNLLYEQVPGFEIEILAYVTKDTLDMRMWQIQEVKLKMINQLRTRQIDRNIDNAFEDMEMSAGEMQAAATGNMDLLREIQARADIKKLEQRRRSFDAQKSDLVNRRKSVAQRLQGLPAQLAQAEVLAEAGALYDKALADQAESFKVTIDGKEYADRYEASKVLLSKVDAKMYVRTAEKDGKKVREEMTAEEHAALAKKVQDMRASGVTGAALDEAVHELTSWDEKAAPLDVELNGEQFTARAKLQEAWSNASGDRDPIVWEYQGQKYNRRAALALALRGPVVDAIADEKLVELGSIGPFKVTAEGQTASAGFHKGEKMLDIVLAYKGKQIEGQIFVPDGETSVKVAEQIATWADRKASGAANELAYLKNEMARAEKAKAELDSADDMGEWPDQGKLEEARKRHQDILKRLGGKTADGAQDPAFAQSDAAGGMSAAIVQHTVDMLAAEWHNAPHMVALSSIAGAPARVRDDARARMARGGGKPKAVLYSGTVYLFSDALRDQAEAAEYAYHEVLGHYGMRGHFGEDLDRELKNIVQLRGADITRMYERTGKERSAATDLRMAEEVVAYMAQTQPELNFVKRVIATIKNFLRDHVPGFASLNMSDADIIQKFILPARRFVQGPDGPNSGGELEPAFGAGSPVFYSALARGIADNPAQGLPSVGWLGAINSMVNKGQSKADEVEWSGITDWLKTQQGKIPKEAVLAFLEQNGVRVQEVHKGDAAVKTSAWYDTVVKLDALGYTLDQNIDGIIVTKRSSGDQFVWDENDGIVYRNDTERSGEDEFDLEAMRLMEVAHDVFNDEGDEDARGGDPESTRYSTYTLPGGENYREVLLTLPPKPVQGKPYHVVRDEVLLPAIKRAIPGIHPKLVEDDIRRRHHLLSDRPPRTDEEHALAASAARYEIALRNAGEGHALDAFLASFSVNAQIEQQRRNEYKSGHWDEKNILAHIRLNDRTDAEGKRVLFVEEVQSDWAQAGKKQGFAVKDIEAERERLYAAGDIRGAATVAIDNASKLPAAPFVGKTDAWVTLALKRIVKMAVDEGYDKVAFVTGDQSADRYSLEKQVRHIHWSSRQFDSYKNVSISPTTGNAIEFAVAPDGTIGGMRGGIPSGTGFDGKNITDVIGKDLGERLLSESYGDLSGDGLKIGGEGMKAFYDKIIPAAANKLLAKIGGEKVNEVIIQTGARPAGDLSNDGEAARQFHDMSVEAWNSMGRQERNAMIREYAEQEVLNEKAQPQPGFDITEAMREKAGQGLPLFGQAELERIALLAKELATIEGRMPAIKAVAPEARVEDGKLVVNKENATRVRRILGTPAVGAGPMFAQGEDREDTGQVPPSGKAASKLLESITIDNVRRHAGYKFTDYRTLGLGILGRRQIAELYAKDLPDLAQYSELVQQMDADKNEEGAAADGVARAWGKLPDEKALANLMHDATLAQIDPANDYMTGDSHIDYEVLRRDWDRLTPEAKTIYVQARDMYEEHYARVREAMRERIERAEISDERKADLLARMDGEFFDRIKGVYFPLARFGKYVVVVKDADGDTASVSRAETMGEAMESRAAMQKAFPEDKGFKISKVLLAAEFNASRDGVGRGFLKSLFNVLDQEGVSDELQDAINQLYLSSLPDLSWAKHGIHRKGTPGFSQDARRAFAQNMFHGARYLAKLRYADQLQTLLDSMEKTVKTNEETQGFDSVKAQQVVDEMTKRHDLLMNPKSNPLSTALTSIGFVFHMGLSPASAMVNLSQTGLVSYPAMGARWGFGKAGKALLEAGREAAVSKNDLSTVLKDDELRAYDAAVKAGTIDVTLAHDLAGIAQGEDSKVVWKMRPVMRAASFLFHHAERFNRQVTFIAAYRLARAAGAGHQPAYKQATQVTYDTHFDYSSGNRPRFMQGNMARVLLLFKQFAQNMIYTITRQAYLSMKGLTPEDRKLARKNLAGLLVMHAAGAGVLGLPLVGTLLAAASFIGGGDDEPWDAEVALRNMLADALGQKPAEVLAHGLSRLTPFDISGRVGLDKLILPDIQEGLEGVRLAESIMASALGPVAGIGINVARGAQKIGEGNWARGLEDMMPSALRGPLKALRYAQEGAIDKTGIPIVDNVGPVAVLGQALGLSPSEVREATEGKSAVKRLDSRISERRRILLQQYSKAMALGDSDAVTDARAEIQEFNNKQPDYRIKGESMLKSVVNRRRRIADAEDGIYLPKGHRSTREAGRFARDDE